MHTVYRHLLHTVYRHLLLFANDLLVLQVESETSYSRVSGTSMGGGTFWGLGSLLTGVSEFDDLIKLAAAGNHKNVMLYNLLILVLNS